MPRRIGDLVITGHGREERRGEPHEPTGPGRATARVTAHDWLLLAQVLLVVLAVAWLVASGQITFGRLTA